MARRSSGRSKSSGFSMPRPMARSTPPKPRPAPQPASGSAPVQSGSATGGLGSIVAEGMAFGGGNAIAHRAVDALMGPRVVRHETVVADSAAAPTPPVKSVGASDACGNQYKAFQDCLNGSGSEISRCQFYMDMLAECRKSTPSGLNV